jgi:hypothetical protein
MGRHRNISWELSAPLAEAKAFVTAFERRGGCAKLREVIRVNPDSGALLFHRLLLDPECRSQGESLINQAATGVRYSSTSAELPRNRSVFLNRNTIPQSDRFPATRRVRR